MLSLQALLVSTGTVTLAEIGDKTQLLALLLAARYRKPWPIALGILAATLVNHAISAWLGAELTDWLSPEVLRWVVAASFLAVALWTLKPDTLDETASPARFGAFLTTVILFFLAEMGDKTQFATVAVAARYQSVLWVTIGTTLGMMASNGLAVFLGEKLAGKVQAKWIRWSAASLFFLFGVVSLVAAVQGVSPTV